MKGSSGSGKKQTGSSPCAACKLLRRRCDKQCVFAPYFPAHHPHKFINVHKVYDASNVYKMLQWILDSDDVTYPAATIHMKAGSIAISTVLIMDVVSQ
ncbi:LOB domain-containing protein 4 [Senna tora]|uniref:LOB domain-containing protein 4 n=1 Tax=Senna tora TaxID=362788 RepID=A0A834WRT7_9FABA|nr:LOB domain-containing protein 4 [Senna tora]KAF7830061.1 LOB domain-containing protein 4 [Senna tora]